MSLITKIQELAGAIGGDVKILYTRIGTLGSLTTTEKTNLVGALNEVKEDLDTLDSTSATIDDVTPSETSVYSSTKTEALYDLGVSNSEGYSDDAVNDFKLGHHDPLASSVTSHIGNTTGHPNATTSVAGFMTGADKTKLNGLETGATADQTGAEIKALYEAEANTNAYTDTEKTLVGTALQPADLTGLATETYVDGAVSDLVDSSPGTLDTLNELAAALGDDPNFATTTSTAIGNRLRFDEASTLTSPQAGYARDAISAYSRAELGNPDTNLTLSYTAARDA